MKTIMVGVDGSAPSTTALHWATGLAVATQADVLAVNAYQSPYSEVSPDDHRALVAERREELERWTAPVLECGVEVERVVREGDPRDVVPALAGDREVGLLVLGRIGSGGAPGLFHLGSVVEHAAHHTAVPLATIPAGWPAVIERVAVGVDGSPEAGRAVEFVAEIASALNASVDAVHCDEPASPLTSDDEVAWRIAAERHLHDWTAAIGEVGVPIVPILQRDVHPADGLLAVAQARRSDVLVIGMRGLGGFTGLRAGGVALKVLHRASMPLVLVPSR